MHSTESISGRQTGVTHTELGSMRIPFGWKIVKIGDVAKIKSGKDQKSIVVEQGKYPIFGTGGEIGRTNEYLWDKPSVMIGRKGTIDKPRYIESPFWTVDTLFYTELSEHVVVPKWLFYKFQTINWKRYNEATGVPSLNSTVISSIKILLPEIGQQRRMSAILSTIDGQIEKTEAIIAKYHAIKQGMLQDLFTRGIDVNTGTLRPTHHDKPELFVDSLLGKIPKDWSLIPIQELTTYVDYRGKTPPKSDNGIFLVTAKNVKFGYIDYEVSQEYIPVEKYDQAMSRGLPEIGDVLFTTEAPMGNVAQLDRSNIALAQRVIKYRAKPNYISSSFLRLSLMADYFQSALVKEASGSTVLGIKGSKLHKIKLLLPELPEQERICLAVESIERLLASEMRKQLKECLLKQGLMNDLLSGVIRVQA